jgi:nucleoside-diphosphate-sugar epimerase
MQKVLVTGATGYIGDYVVQELLRKQFEIIATGTSQIKAEAKFWHSQVTFIPFNFNTFDDSVNYYNYFKNPDIVIHLAWDLTKNLPVQLNFLRNLIQYGLKDLTVTGTCFEYGMKNIEGCLTETMPCIPDNAYAQAKNTLRIELEKITKENQCSFKWLRLFYMYGKGQNSKSLISQLDKALENNESLFNMSGGEQVRDFLPVQKVAEYIVAAATQQNVTGVINCCSNMPVTVKQFVETYISTANKKIKLNLGYYPYPDYEAMRFWGDNNKLKSIIDASKNA